MSITSSEINYLVYRYLSESGYNHTAFTFFYESEVDKTVQTVQHRDVPLGMLVSVLQKGLQYSQIEAHIQADGTYKPCTAPFTLLAPHHCTVADTITSPTATTTTTSSSSSSGLAMPPFTLTSPTFASASTSMSSPAALSAPSTPNSANSPAKTNTQNSANPGSQLSITTIVNNTAATSAAQGMEVEEEEEEGNDVATTATALPLSAAGVRVTSSQVSPSGAQVFSIASDGSVRLYSTSKVTSLLTSSLTSSSTSPADGEERILVPSQGATSTAAAIATVAQWRGDSALLAVGYGDGACRVWDAAAGRLVRELRGGHQGPVARVAWSPRGTRLCTVGGGETGDSACVWDVATWTQAGRCSVGSSEAREAVAGVAWRGEDALAVAAGANVHYFAVGEGKGQSGAVVAAHSKRVVDIAWDPNSHSALASVADDATLRITTFFDSVNNNNNVISNVNNNNNNNSNNSGNVSSKVVLTLGSQPVSVKWIPGSGQRVAVLTKECVVVWDVAKEVRETVWKCGGAGEEWRELEVSKSGRWAAVTVSTTTITTTTSSMAAGGGGVRVWDARERKGMEDVTDCGRLVRCGGVCHDLSWGQSDDWLALCCCDKSCIVDLRKK